MSLNRPLTFASAARVVYRRCLKVRLLHDLEKSGPWVALALVAGTLVLRFTGVPFHGGGMAFLMLAAWLVFVGIWGWLSRLAPPTAMARWDRLANRHEGFVSALSFEGVAERTAGEERHLARMRPLLGPALDRLPEVMPLRLSWRGWGAMPLAALVLMLPMFRPSLLPEDRRLEEADRGRLEEVRAMLVEEDERLDKLDNLTENELNELNQLREGLRETLDDLEDADERTRRELLEALEQRAREAEELARELTAGAEALSESFLAELERHGDLESIASALRGQDLEALSEAVAEQAERLESPDVSLETQERLKNALAEALQKASEQDRKTKTWQHLAATRDKLQAREPEAAGKQLRQWSENLQQQRLRQQAQQRLQQLAQQLRRSGQNLIASNQNLAQQLPQQPGGSGGQQLQAGSPLGALPMQLGGPPTRSASTGTGGAPSGANPQAGMTSSSIPVPGMGTAAGGASRGGQMPGNAGQSPGSGAGGIPVPGSSPGSGLGAGSAPAGGLGGLQAGTGSASYTPATTPLYDPTQLGSVDAARNSEGDSQVRPVEGQAHAEKATAQPKAVTLQTLEAEEASLGDDRLPLSRRDQVRRYFNAIRRQLE